MSEATMSAGQLMLVSLENLPERPDVVEWIESQPRAETPTPWRHTGRRFLQKLAGDGDLAQAVCEGLATGLSVRLLAWRLGVSPNTLAAARRAMTDRGELEPVRKRVDALLDDVAEEGLEYWLEGMRSGVIHPGQIPIPTLAAITNKGQREAGIVPGTDRTVEENTLARVRAAWELARAADAVSGRTAQDGPIIEVTPVVDTGPDTTAAVPGTSSGDQVAADGGGGRPAPASQEHRWADPAKF